MIRCFLPFVVLFFCTAASAQQPYWQQRADHRIRVSLDDRTHTLRGAQTIDYTNNSPDTLRFLYIELYMNGFSSKKTFYAKEKLRKGDWDFQKADAVDMGRVDSLSFTSNNQPLAFELDAENPDYGKLMLAKPLAPGEKIELQNAFRVKLPKTFSRGGHDGQSYQVTQWFPKPAVYDATGWHPIPYSEQGEYYAEFGSYDVSITLPANYLVGATGNLQTEKEKQWLNELATKYKSSLDKSNAPTNPFDQTDSTFTGRAEFPPSSPRLKTLRYTADNVQDFAWFADKRFYVLKSEVTLPHSGRKVDTWAFFHSEKRKNLWQHGPEYIDTAVYYYSKWVGDYAHDQATAVEGALIAGAGMEYPNVTVIGDMTNAKSLEEVIVHEVGHNWFQGMLGSNERLNPWMDEGLNSYYENRVLQRNVTHDTIPVPRGINKLIGLDNVSPAYRNQLAALYQSRRSEDQPICLPANAFTPTNYGAMVYLKTPVVFNYLEHQIGQAETDQLFQRYFNEYKFKHPTPADMQRVFDSSGLELDWLFHDALCTTKHLDYKITSIDTTVIAGSSFYKIRVKNIGGVKGPFGISSLDKNETQLAIKRYGGFLGKNELLFPYSASTKALRLDADESTYEYNRHNNTIRTKGLFKKCEPIKPMLFTGIERPYRNAFYFLPAVGYNMYDGFQIGMLFHNLRVPPGDFEWALVPMYATNRKMPSGIARMQGYLHPHGLKYIKPFLLLSSFGYDDFEIEGLHAQPYFLKTTAGVDFAFNTRSLTSKSILGAQEFFIEDNLRYGYNAMIDDLVEKDNFTPHTVYKLRYSYENKRSTNPYSFAMQSRFIVNGELKHDDAQLDLSGEFNYRFSYSKKKGLDIRLFAGTERGDIVPIHLGATPGYHDITYSHYFVGRSETTTEGAAAQQVLLNEGGLKFVTPANLFFPIGESTTAVSLNLKSSLPIPIVFLFADAGYAPIDNIYNFPISSDASSFMYDAGVGLKIIPDVCEIYLPFVFSQDLKTQVIKPYRTEWYERIVFTLQLERLSPFDLFRNVQLN